MGLFGPPNIENLKAKRDMQGLIKALDYTKDSSVRVAAAEALGEIRDERAIEPLIFLLQDVPENLRLAAFNSLLDIGAPAVESLIRVINTSGQRSIASAIALGAIGDVRAVEPLIAALNYEEVRPFAVNSLGEIGDTRAIKPIIGVLNSKDDLVRKYAVEALEKFCWQPDKSEAGAIYWIVKREWDRCIEIGEPAVEPLMAVLRDADKEVCLAAIGALEKIGGPQALESLCVVITEYDEDLIWQAAQLALEKIGIQAVGPLIARLKWPLAYSKKGRLVQTLGNIGDKRAVQPLVTALQDKLDYYCEAREPAAEALGSIGDEQAVEPLIAILRSQDVKKLRPVAAKALGKIGDRRAVEPLITALTDDCCVREAAIALGRICDERAFEPLIAALETSSYHHEEIREAIARVTKALPPKGDERIVKALIIVFATQDKEVRKVVVTTLKTINWQPSSNDARVVYLMARDQWTEILDLGDRAVDVLLSTLKKIEQNYRFSDIVKHILNTLEQIGDARSREKLIDLIFEHPDDFVYYRIPDLFGIFTERLQTIVGIFERNLIHSKDSPIENDAEYIYGHHTEPLDAVVKFLCTSNNPIATNLLHKLALFDVPGYYGESPWSAMYSAREQARNELQRRGNPSYDHQAYLIDRNFL
jgi:HEAT repeat protein